MRSGCVRATQPRRPRRTAARMPFTFSDTTCMSAATLAAAHGSAALAALAARNARARRGWAQNYGRPTYRRPDTHDIDGDDRPPICPRCGVTMVPAALSADDKHEGDWVCL